jgi:hypothetical protein
VGFGEHTLQQGRLAEPRKPVTMVAGIRLMKNYPCASGGGPSSGVDANRSKVPDVSRARTAASGKLAAFGLPTPSSGAFRHVMSETTTSRAQRSGERTELSPERRSLFQKLVELVAPAPDSRDQLIESLADAEQKELIHRSRG